MPNRKLNGCLVVACYLDFVSGEMNEHDSYSVHNLQPQSEHASLMTGKALTYEVSYLGKVQICAILSLPIWSISLI